MNEPKHIAGWIVQLLLNIKPNNEYWSRVQNIRQVQRYLRRDVQTKDAVVTRQLDTRVERI